MLVAAAFVPTPPLLVPEIGSGNADSALRDACGAAVERLLASGADSLVVVGTAPTTSPVRGGWDWRGFGVDLPVVAPDERLPLALAIGSWLLDAQSSPTYTCQGVAPDLSAAECAALGVELVSGDRRVGLLVCGDGSACRTEKAPGFFDPAAEPWDTAALTALRTADAAALLSLDVEVAHRVLATGRTPWQVLAGAAADGAFDAVVDWADAPYGVMYIAGTWIRKDDATR